MADRCKPGDIAIIIKDEPGCEANIGRVVHVLGPRKVFLIRGTVWLIKPVIGKTITYVDIDKKVKKGLATKIEHDDDWLLPIRPEANDDHVAVSKARPVVQELEAI